MIGQHLLQGRLEGLAVLDPEEYSSDQIVGIRGAKHGIEDAAFGRIDAKFVGRLLPDRDRHFVWRGGLKAAIEDEGDRANRSYEIAPARQ